MVDTGCTGKVLNLPCASTNKLNGEKLYQMFDIGYVGDLVLKIYAIEEDYQKLKAERDWYLMQIGMHAGFIGNLKKPLDEGTAKILFEFIQIFIKSNPQYKPIPESGIVATDFTLRTQPVHFGGVRDDD